MYQEKILKHLASCLEEILSTAFNRLSALKIIELNSYGSFKGKETRFLLCHEDGRPELMERLNLLSKLRNFSNDEIQHVESEI